MASDTLALRNVPRDGTAPRRISMHMVWHWRDASIVPAVCAPVLGAPLTHALHRALHESFFRVMARHMELLNGAYTDVRLAYTNAARVPCVAASRQCCTQYRWHDAGTDSVCDSARAVRG